MEEGLQSCVHEACIAHVVEASAAGRLEKGLDEFLLFLFFKDIENLREIKTSRKLLIEMVKDICNFKKKTNFL